MTGNISDSSRGGNSKSDFSRDRGGQKTVARVLLVSCAARKRRRRLGGKTGEDGRSGGEGWEDR